MLTRSRVLYEMRTYTYAPGDLPKVLEAWGKVIESRERLSPLAGCFTSEFGGLNKFSHIWPYKDLAERTSMHAAVHNTFNLQRHLISRSTLRIFRAEATAHWQEAVAAT